MVPARFLLRLAFCWLTVVCMSLPAVAQDKRDFDYREIPQQPIESGDKIEVIDFFWYGCPYCNSLPPILERWISNKPADITVRRIPAILRDNWAPHARVFYTLEALGEVERLHQRAYSGQY